MKFKSIICMLGLTLFLVSCGPKDAEVEKEIIAKMGDMPGMQVSVKDGVATIAGVCKDQACKVKCEEIAKSVKGVKSVVNNCEVAAFEVIEPAVTINPDEVLTNSTKEVLKSYPDVTATVASGVITLTGEIKRDQLPELIKSMQELKPKKVENKLIIK